MPRKRLIPLTAAAIAIVALGAIAIHGFVPSSPGAGVPSPAAPVGTDDSAWSASDLPQAPLMGLIDPEHPDGAASGVGTAVDAGTAQQLAFQVGRPIEVQDARTPTSSTFALPDGTWTQESSFSPEWVWEADGAGSGWSPTDVRIVAEDGGTLRPRAQVDGLRFSAGGGEARSVFTGSIPGTAVSLELQWDGGQLPAAVVDGGRITYPAIADGVDLVIEVRPTGYEQYFVVRDAQAARGLGAIPLTLAFDGATVEPSSGGDGYDIVDQAGAVVGHSPQPVAWDHIDDLGLGNPITMPWMDTPRAGMYDALLATLSGSAKSDLEAQLVTHGGDPEFATNQVALGTVVESGASAVDASYVVPAEWLSDPSTSYPIVVDPSNDWNPSLDTWVQFGWTSNQVNSTELKFGSVMSGSTHYIARSYFWWDMGAMHGWDVTSATLYLWDFHAAACAVGHPYVLYRTAGWPSTYLKYNAVEPAWWAQMAGASDAYSGDLCGGSAWNAMDVTDLAKQYERESASTQYFGLRANNDGDVHDWRRVNSANASSYRPIFRVYYNQAPSAPTNVMIGTAALTSNLTAGTARPILAATVSDPDGGTIQARFTIRDHQSGVVVVDSIAGSSVSVGAGGTGSSSVTCPYALQPGVAYDIEVRASDGRLLSGPTSPPFTVTGAAGSAPDDLPTLSDTSTGAVS